MPHPGAHVKHERKGVEHKGQVAAREEPAAAERAGMPRRLCEGGARAAVRGAGGRAGAREARQECKPLGLPHAPLLALHLNHEIEAAP